MAELQFGSIFAQALQNSMAEKAAERKWNQQLDFQNTQLKQQKELADKEFAQKKEISDREFANYEAANFFTPTETDPLVAKYNLLRPNERVNQTIYQNALTQAKDYEDYATNFNKNFKFYANKEEAEKTLKTIFPNQPDLFQQALAGLLPEETFLGAKQQYGLRNFKPQGFDKNVLDMEGSQYFLPSDMYYDLQNKNFQANEAAKELAGRKQIAAMSNAGTFANIAFERERMNKTPIVLEYTTLDGRKRTMFTTQGDYESGKYLDKFPKEYTDANNKKGNYREKIKSTVVPIASGWEAQYKFLERDDILSKLYSAQDKYKITGEELDSAVNYSSSKNKSAISNIYKSLSNMNKNLAGTNFTYYDVNTAGAKSLDNKVTTQLRKLYEKATNYLYIFSDKPSFESFIWLDELEDDEYDVAKDLLNIKGLVYGRPVVEDTDPKTVIEFWKKQYGMM